MILAIDENSMFEYTIENFGLDNQLHELIEGIKNRNLDQEVFKKHPNFDPSKLKVELHTFLKFIVQLCISEISFLKQLINRKEEKAE
jgi:hypothetical protein